MALSHFVIEVPFRVIESFACLVRNQAPHRIPQVINLGQIKLMGLVREQIAGSPQIV